MRMKRYVASIIATGAIEPQMGIQAVTLSIRSYFFRIPYLSSMIYLTNTHVPCELDSRTDMPYPGVPKLLAYDALDDLEKT